MGHIALVTSRNTRGIDLIVSMPEDGKSAQIQVKTRSGKSPWRLSEKVEHEQNDNLFYVFVDINGTINKPEYYIFSSKFVADYIKRNHEKYEKYPNHKKTNMRIFPYKFKGYEDVDLDKHKGQWDILGLK